MQDYKKLYEKEATLKEKNAKIIRCLAKWIKLVEKGYTLVPFFSEKRCETIAIYGFSTMAELLIDEIKNDGRIGISYLFDKNAINITKRNHPDFPVLLPEQYENSDGFDMLVVTPVFYYEEIRRELLMKKPEIPIISILRIIEFMEKEIIYASYI